MKESYGEGVANRIGSESCLDYEAFGCRVAMGAKGFLAKVEGL